MTEELSFNILTYLIANISVLNQDTEKIWKDALEDDLLALQKKKDSTDPATTAVKDNHFYLEIAQMRTETLLREKYSQLIEKQNQEIDEVFAEQPRPKAKEIINRVHVIQGKYISVRVGLYLMIEMIYRF